MTLRASTGAGVIANNVTITGGSQDAVTYTLGTFAYGGNLHQSFLAGQTTTGVAAVATVIFTTPGDGATLTVCGSDGTNRFSDTVIYGLSDTPVVTLTHTAAGAPASRTYSNTSGQLKLLLASGTYNINAFGMISGQR